VANKENSYDLPVPLNSGREISQPHEVRLVVIDQENTISVNTWEILGVLKNKRIAESLKQKIFIDGVSSLSGWFYEGKIKRKEFSQLFSQILLLDDSRDKARISSAIVELSDEKYTQVIDSLSSNTLSKLQLPDLDDCKAKRMATYIKSAANRYVRADSLRTEALHTFKEEKVESMGWKQALAEDHLSLFIETVSNRNGDPRDYRGQFLYEVCIHLLDEDETEAVPYVLEALEILCDCDNECAEEMLEMLKRITRYNRLRK
jgi:hypothetical protein